MTLLKGGDNLTPATNGFTYQIWAWNEQNLALSPQEANILFEKARVEYSGIDVEFYRMSLLQGLKAAQNSKIRGD